MLLQLSSFPVIGSDSTSDKQIPVYQPFDLPGQLLYFISNSGQLFCLCLKMATGGDIDTSELAKLWSEEHVSQLPTFEHFHNIHQIKVEESLDALPAKLYKNPENLPQKSKYKCVKLRAKDKEKRNTPCEKMY